MYSELNDAPTEGLLCVKEVREALSLSGPDLSCWMIGAVTLMSRNTLMTVLDLHGFS